MSDGRTGVRAMWMRGGTSKGGFFLAGDLPDDPAARDDLLLRVMGSPDPRQIDGLGGADPLTSKIAVVKRSAREDADVDYLFLQVFVDQAIVSDSQNCGNMLAAVAPFAIERGLVGARDGETSVRIYMENTGQVAVATVRTPGGVVTYGGDARIDGVPNPAAAIPLAFQDVAGSSCGSLLPTGSPSDVICGTRVTLIDNGMPCVILAAACLGVTGLESREVLDADVALKASLERIRLQSGPLMKLGDVSDKSVPKMILVSAPQQGGAIGTRSFIPHRCHASIGVFAAVTVASACLIKGSTADGLAELTLGPSVRVSVEHPSGETTCLVGLDEQGRIASTSLLRSARKLFDGVVF